MVEISPLLNAFVKTLGFKEAKEVYWEAISGTPHNVRSRRVKSFKMFFYCLNSYDYHILHITNPKVELENEPAFIINQVDILIKKDGSSFNIEKIFIEEEEYEAKTDITKRLKKMWEITKFGLTLFALFSKFIPSE